MSQSFNTLAHWETKYVIKDSFALTIQLLSKCTCNLHTTTADSQTWQMRKMENTLGLQLIALIQSNSGGHLMLILPIMITMRGQGQDYIDTFNVVGNANQT